MKKPLLFLFVFILGCKEKTSQKAVQDLIHLCKTNTKFDVPLISSDIEELCSQKLGIENGNFQGRSGWVDCYQIASNYSRSCGNVFICMKTSCSSLVP